MARALRITPQIRAIAIAAGDARAQRLETFPARRQDHQHHHRQDGALRGRHELRRGRRLRQNHRHGERPSSIPPISGTRSSSTSTRRRATPPARSSTRSSSTSCGRPIRRRAAGPCSTRSTIAAGSSRRSYLDEAVASSPSSLNDPVTAADAGNGFLFRFRGYSLVWSGWDPDAPTGQLAGLVVRVPTATDHGAPIRRMIRDEFVFGTRIPETSPTAPLVIRSGELRSRRREAHGPRPRGRSAASHPRRRLALRQLARDRAPARGDQVQARLHLRFPLPRAESENRRHRLCGDTRPRLLPALRGQGRIQDARSARRRRRAADQAHALGFGISQSGRYLRDHVGQGFNQDEAGRTVFDGILAHISGIGRVFDNAEFSQPYRTNTQHEDHFFPENAFPFAHGRLRDPITGKSGGLLRGDGFDPLIIESNTATEYWQKGASLLLTDPLGQHDIAIPDTRAALHDRRDRACRPRRTRRLARELHQSAQSPQSGPGAARLAGRARRRGCEAGRRRRRAGSRPIADGTLVPPAEPASRRFPASRWRSAA